MIAITDESRDKLIYWLDMARHNVPNLKQEERVEIDSLIAEVENTDPVPDPTILVAVWERDGAEYMMRVDARFVPTESSTDIFFAIPDDYLAIKRKHGLPSRWEIKPISEYGKQFTSGDACEFFATEATA